MALAESGAFSGEDSSGRTPAIGLSWPVQGVNWTGGARGAVLAAERKVGGWRYGSAMASSVAHSGPRGPKGRQGGSLCHNGFVKTPESAPATGPEFRMPSTFVSGISYSTIEIIDCVPAWEMQTGLALYNHIRDIAPNSSVPRITRRVVSSEREFWQALDSIEADCHTGWKPIIHIEGHASKAGFEVGHRPDAAGSSVCWHAVVDRLRAINIACDFNLGVFVAACEGIEALRPLTIKEPTPYMFLVGPKVKVTADVMKTSARNFYDVVVKKPDLNRAFATLPPQFIPFLAEKFFMTMYAGVLKKQSFGQRRKERVNLLVKMALPGEATLERLQEVREMAKVFSRPDVDRFEAARRVFLPAGLSFTFDDLVEFARSGKLPE